MHLVVFCSTVLNLCGTLDQIFSLLGFLKGSQEFVLKGKALEVYVPALTYGLEVWIVINRTSNWNKLPNYGDWATS